MLILESKFDYKRHISSSVSSFCLPNRHSSLSLNTFVRSFSRFFVLFVFFVLKLENSWAGENRYPKVAIEALCVFYDRNNEDQQYPLFTHFKLSRTNESRTISTKLSLQTWGPWLKTEIERLRERLNKYSVFEITQLCGALLIGEESIRVCLNYTILLASPEP